MQFDLRCTLPCNTPMQTFYIHLAINVNWDNSRYLWAILECTECRSPYGNPRTSSTIFHQCIHLSSHGTVYTYIMLRAMGNKIISREHMDKIHILVHHHLVPDCSCCRAFIQEGCTSFNQQTDLNIKTALLLINFLPPKMQNTLLHRVLRSSVITFTCVVAEQARHGIVVVVVFVVFVIKNVVLVLLWLWWWWGTRTAIEGRKSRDFSVRTVVVWERSVLAVVAATAAAALSGVKCWW